MRGAILFLFGSMALIGLFQNCSETKFSKFPEVVEDVTPQAPGAAIELFDKVINEGQTLFLEANVLIDAKNPVFVWKKAGREIMSSAFPQMSVASTSLEDSGSYSVEYYDGNSLLGKDAAIVTVLEVVAPAPAPTPAPVPKQKKSVTKKFVLGASSCGGGWCDTAISGKCGSVDPKKSDRICKNKGYEKSTARASKPGPRTRLCGPNGTGCFINQNPTCNRVFTSVTCQRME